mmetsp:Transcript_5747/g.15342  ORF Transcript_5747/g.15342 Transcript_5747/m.15342 type:complete len:148 (-) Transcript_5747:329-772(-)
MALQSTPEAHSLAKCAARHKHMRLELREKESKSRARADGQLALIWNWRQNLNGLLVAPACAATTSALKLAPLRAHIRFDVTLLRNAPEVLVDLASVFPAAKQNSVLSKRRAQRELVESDAFSAGLLNAHTSRIGKFERAHGQLRHVK